MIKRGETYQGRTVKEINGSWIKYLQGDFEGECHILDFQRRWVVLPQAIKATESPSKAAAVEG